MQRARKALELYLEKGILDPQLVREEVAHSWQRCRDLSLNPLISSRDESDPERDLEKRRYEREHLIHVAHPFLSDLSRFVSGTNFQVILTDENGMLLEVAGDPRIVTRARQVHLCAGADWSESFRGTNAIGTALFEQVPVQIHAWEHFREENQFLTCSASPIFDPAGNIAGAIDISGDYREANPHTLGMVVSATHAIENQLRLEATMAQLSFASHYSNAIIRGITDGLIAIDTKGIVTEINARGGEIFGLNPAAVKGLPINQICHGTTHLLQVIATGREYKNQEIALAPSGPRIESSASLLRDDNGSVIGAVAFFRELPISPGARRSIVCFSHHYQFDDIVGESLLMQKAKDWASLAASCASTVLILGESGTGKEIFANAIHHASARKRGPFLAINCAAMPESLIESELFGYCDGSFTGARKGGQAGKFEMANGGTIFLDEVGEMSLSMQAKLLRVLQERTLTRVGSSAEINIDIRVIAATHCDLSKDVESGRFREDLYYRLAVLELRIPPLRERTEDIPRLAQCLVAKIAARLEHPPVTLPPDSIEKLQSYTWPGNVREMENVLERALIRSRGSDKLTPDIIDLPEKALRPLTEREPVARLAESAHDHRSLRDHEKQAIIDALNSCHGNIKRTAEQLGIARNTLYRKMQEYGLV